MNKKIVRNVLIIFFSIAFISGIWYFFMIDQEYRLIYSTSFNNYLVNNDLTFNLLINHLIILSLIIFLSFFIIGIGIIPLYFFFEFFSIGFSFGLLIYTYKFNGFIYAFLYNIIGKGLYLMLFYVISKKLLKIAKNNYYLLFKHNTFKINNFINNIKSIIIIFIIIILYDLGLLFLGNTILSFINGLLS